jgi:perosamine synthetase
MQTFVPVYEPSITDRELAYVTDAVKSGWISSIGEYIIEFERKFAGFIGVKYALAVSNGTSALHLALASLGVTHGHEVIVPDFTFIATANAVTYTGAKPVFADIDPAHWCIDPEDIVHKITPHTKAIIPVHVYGHPAEMDRIMAIANDYGLYVVEDAAEAHGAEYKGEKTGSFGNFGIFSFYGNKILTTGEGGMLTTDDPKLYTRALELRDQAMSKEKRYWHTDIGFNYRMTNIQAAIGLAQLERIEELLRRKLEIFQWYAESLGKRTDFRLNPQAPWAKNVYWMVCLLLDKRTRISRDDLIAQLRSKGIDSRPFFYPLTHMPMYKGHVPNRVAQDISQCGINLPSGYGLDEETVYRIGQEVLHILQQFPESDKP